jgi:hypothetical protein
MTVAEAAAASGMSIESDERREPDTGEVRP